VVGVVDGATGPGDGFADGIGENLPPVDDRFEDLLGPASPAGREVPADPPTTPGGGTAGSTTTDLAEPTTDRYEDTQGLLRRDFVDKRSRA
jgi:hypothetical protein